MDCSSQRVVQQPKPSTHLKSFFVFKAAYQGSWLTKVFWGIEIVRSKEEIYLSQRKCALELITNIKVVATKPFDTAMEQNRKLTSHGLETNMSYVQCDCKEDVLLSDSDYVIRLIGRVIYLTIKWSYICFAVEFNLVYALSQKITHGCSSSNGEIS